MASDTENPQAGQKPGPFMPIDPRTSVVNFQGVAVPYHVDPRAAPTEHAQLVSVIIGWLVLIESRLQDLEGLAEVAKASATAIANDSDLEKPVYSGPLLALLTHVTSAAAALASLKPEAPEHTAERKEGAPLLKA